MDLDKKIMELGSKCILGFIKENPHMAVSAVLFCGGSVALWQNVTPLAGSLFGAGGALLGAWISELNKRRTDARDKARKEAEAVAALAPELQRTIERLWFILDRAIANFSNEWSITDIKINDQQKDFRPYTPTLYPGAPPVRDLPGEKAITLIRYYDSLEEISKYIDDWWEREGQLAVNIFNGIMHAAEKSLRLGLICVREFDLEERFSPPYEARGTLSSRIERSLDNALKARQRRSDRAAMPGLEPVKSRDIKDLRKY